MNAIYVFKSNVKILAKEVTTSRYHENTALLNDVTSYIKSGGELQDSYDAIVELIQAGIFVEEEENEETLLVVERIEEILVEILKSPKLNTKDAEKYINFDFVVKIFEIFQRRCSKYGRPKVTQRWKLLLHQLYQQFPRYREYFYNTMVTYFEKLAFKAASQSSLISQINKNCKNEKEEEVMMGPYFVVGELLEVMGSIIAGIKIPIREVHSSLLLPALLRLHNNTVSFDDLTITLSLYHRQLTYCVVQFIEKANTSQAGDAGSNPVTLQILRTLVQSIHTLSKQGNSKQTVYLVNEIEQIIEKSNNATFQSIKSSFFDLLNTCFQSINFTIAQRSILLLSNPKVMERCIAGRNPYFDYTMIASLVKTAKDHWNESSRQMAFQCLNKIIAASPENFYLVHNQDFIHLQKQWESMEKDIKRSEKVKRRNMKKKKDQPLTILDFVYVKELGTGSYSTVHHVRFIDHAVNQLYWEDYALKSMLKSHLINQKYMENIQAEIALFNQLFSHPHIVKLIANFEDDEKIYLLLEYLDEGDLFSLLEKFGTFSYEFGRFVIAEVLSTLLYLHHHKHVVYGDLKPENILMDQSGHIKLTDFASASFLSYPPGVSSSSSSNHNDDHHSNNNVDSMNIDADDESKKKEEKGVVGTLEYLPPKVLKEQRKGVSYFDDVWALGCLTYQLFVGTLPFNGTKEKIITAMNGPFIFPQNIHPQVKLFVEYIFSFAESESLCVSQLKHHSFFEGLQWEQLSHSNPPKPEVGSVEVSKHDLHLRQRKYSMMLTQSLPSTYSYDSFALPAILELDESDLIVRDSNDPGPEN